MNFKLTYKTLSPSKKNKMGIHYGFQGANPYRTFERWLKNDDTGKIRLLNLMVNDFFEKKEIKAKCYHCGVDLGFTVDNEDDNFWSCIECLKKAKLRV